MSVVYVLTNPIPDDGGDDQTMKQVRKMAKWDNDDYVSRGLILNVLEQYNELLGILGRLIQHNMNMDEAIQDNDKPKSNTVASPSVVNMLEHNNSSRYNHNKGKRKHHDNIRADPNKKARPNCWKCGKTSHIKSDCKGVNVGNKANGLGIKGIVDGSSNSLNGQKMFNKFLQVYYVTYVSKAYFVHDDDVACWVGSRVTVHVCKDRCWFKTYKSLIDGSILHMGNESTALVHGHGCVDLKFSYGKIVLLFNVLHVTNIRKNLVSSSILNNCGYKQVIKSNKFVLSKHGMFVGFGYLSNQMFRFNIVNYNIASTFISKSRLNDSILWHARLSHVHFKRMQDMSKDGLILAFNMDTEKCKTRMLTKITKKQFYNVKRETKVLELIPSDLCDLHATPSMGNKKYCVTFIDDASRFCYVYVLHTKDEALDKLKAFKTEVELQQGSLIKSFRTDRGGGYVEHSKAFKFYVIEPNDSALINFIIESKDDIFNENTFSSVPRSNLRIPNGTKDIGGSVVLIEVTKEEQNMRSLTNTPIALMLRMIPRHLMKQQSLKMLLTGNKQLMMRWIPSWATILGCWLIYLQDFKQKLKIYYFDTYALVVRISTIRLLIAMTSIHNLIIHQMDVKTTFLNGELEEEVDMTKEFLSSRSSMKDVGEADVIPGIRIKHESILVTLVLSIASNSEGTEVFLLGGGVISWASKKQTCITGSTIEYEFMALAAAGKEAEWLKNLLFKIPLWGIPIVPISIHCGSATTLAKAYSHMYNGKSRHLGVRHSMIRELIINEVVSIEFVRSQQNFSDHLTKGLARDLVIKSAEWIGLKSNQVTEC
uniref:Zinc finger, CCHC-type n=1 Tax=Tanacetum cinerariifolium TaxID=118510 RepID=A0A6L2M1L3_TANCI|nr:zinc finger, CCHC-type [Tanacetum cinerariifolium]